jgi:hypothetical protein
MSKTKIINRLPGSIDKITERVAKRSWFIIETPN